MVALFSDQTHEGRHFRINIDGRGIYTFRAQGALYHKIGGLLPHEGNRPRFLQAYIYIYKGRAPHEVENRMCESEVLDRCVVEKIQQMLNNHNPFLILKEQPIDRRQYSLPSASQVAAIIIDGDDATIANGRDIMVETISGRLSHVRDYVGFYDPLQYPLLLPYGTYGWDVNIRDDGGRAITCCDYYAYMLQVCSIGRRIILPSSFVGSPRDMYQRYQDAMTLVQRFGKPDLFITMTCNPSWEEIKSELLAGQTPQDRPDLLTRVFCAKLEQLKEDIIENGVLGSVVAYAYVIEFQKRGLPHVHMLVVLDENDKINNPDEYDRIVRAEIPNEDVEPQLYNVVLKHMIHGPCGIHNPQSPCMKNGSCKRKYPKPFAPVTVQGNDSYPIYQRRGNRLPVSLDRQGNIMVDNSWVIPYNPWLLLSVKYLYKYVYKGPDRVTVEVQSDPEYDEIKQFQDARWVCAPEALWKIFKFIINRIYPSFRADESIINILHDESTRKTMLTDFFTLNHVDAEARRYLYMEIPSHYRWIQAQRKWSKRMNRNKVIGRIYAVSPAEGENFYLRILLNHVRGPTSFTNLRTVNGVLHPTFKQAAEQRGLLERDDNIRQCLVEASTIQMPSALRRLFVTILFYPFMIEDYVSMTNITPTLATNRLLRELNILLVQFNKSINEFDLPQMTRGNESSSGMTRCIEDEISIGIPQQDLDAIERLNDDQRSAFNIIMGGPGGTGKTYLYRALLASLRRLGHIVLATASSGIAATILPGGRTAHSKFKIPLSLDASSMCSIGKQSDLAKLIQKAKAIIWDEATMAHRHAFEALDRTFRDLIDIDLPFGGKIMIFGGDFRQVLPVIRKGTKSELIQASVVKASFWSHVKILKLKQNMRSINDREFSEFLLRVGDGNEDVIMDDMVKLPECMVIPWESEHSINQLIAKIFPDLEDHMNDATYMVERAVVSITNEDVNEKIINMFPGLEETMYSFDSVEDDERNLYQPEFLNSISLGGLPPHKLTLKRGAPIMLLRNIDPKLGLCNGTRLLCRGSYRNLIDAEILTGQFAGSRVFLPRILLKSTDTVGLPFELTRKQFPVKLSFSITINKSQGQTIPHVGVYLPDHVFSHGQLYVALSRGVSKSTTTVLVKNGSIVGQQGVFTRNIGNENLKRQSGTNGWKLQH
ncbi:unnamed protein product [Malus baccata var. baccata]